MRYAILPADDTAVERGHHKCPECKTTHRRNVWSLAHADVMQVFTCGCGAKLRLRPEPLERIAPGLRSGRQRGSAEALDTRGKD